MTFTPSVFYKDPMSMLPWLERAFGFETTLLIEGPDGNVHMMHSEMALNGKGRVMVGAEWGDWVKAPANLGGANTQQISVRLEAGIDAHCERARASGARVVQEPADQPYGARTYRAIDPEGHEWGFAGEVSGFSREQLERAGSMIRQETETAAEAQVFESQPIYTDVHAALDWLARAFGFETVMLIENTEGPFAGNIRAHVTSGPGLMAIGNEWTDSPGGLRVARRSPRSLAGANTQSLSVDIESDIDGHCEHARHAGAIIVEEPNDQFYGERIYRAVDLEGHHWRFGQTIATMTVPEIEAASGVKIRESL